MARVKRVDRSRKPHVCGRGGHEIPAGDPYLTASPGFRATPKYRCVKHPFRPSELTTSLASEPMAAVESFEEAAAVGFDTHDDLEAAWTELGEAVEEYQQTREQALEAWENGNSQLEEFVETANTALDEVQGHDIESFDDTEPEEPGPEPDPEQEPDEYEVWEGIRDEWQEWEERRREHLDAQTDEALSVAGSLEF